MIRVVSPHRVHQQPGEVVAEEQRQRAAAHADAHRARGPLWRAVGCAQAHSSVMQRARCGSGALAAGTAEWLLPCWPGAHHRRRCRSQHDDLRLAARHTRAEQHGRVLHTCHASWSPCLTCPTLCHGMHAH